MSIRVSCPLQLVMSMVVQKKERSTRRLLTIFLGKDHCCLRMARREVQVMLIWAVFCHVTRHQPCPRRSRILPCKEATRFDWMDRLKHRWRWPLKWPLLKWYMDRSILVRASDIFAMTWLFGLHAMDPIMGVYTLRHCDISTTLTSLIVAQASINEHHYIRPS